MPITRTFLDWSQPPLPEAARWLINAHADGAAVDLSNLLIVVPGGRVQRRLTELLLDEAERGEWILDLPEIVTLGDLPERLYAARFPFANNLTQHLAWVRALQETPRESLEPYFPHLPPDDELFDWLPYGEQLATLHRELAADGLDFAAVCTGGGKLDNFPEADRWRALAAVQRAYLDSLDALQLWDRQTARLYAIKHRECQTDSRIVLIGTVDMNRATRQMIDQVADRVTAVIFAPRELSSRFDEHGCLIPGKWPHALAPLRDEQIEIVSRPGDQADAVLRTLADWDGRFAADEIIIGVPEETLVPYVEQRLEAAGLAARYGVGKTASETSVGRFLEQAASWLERPTADEFAHLLRHPAVEEWLRRTGTPGDWLTELDKYRGEHLQRWLGDPWLGQQTHRAVLCSAADRLHDVLAEWRFKTRPLADWTQPLVDLLAEVFQTTADARESEARKIVGEAIRRALETFRDLPGSLAPAVSGAACLRLVLDAVRQTPVPAEPDAEAIELLGWLELPWDDAPAMIVTGMNEGTVPSSLNADLFLPNRLRQVLQLEDNQRRFARDAYALSLLAASRTELRLIAGKLTPKNDPLIPSRLLFGDDQQTMVERTLRFFAEAAAGPPAPVPGRLSAGVAHADFQPPPPEPLEEPLTRLRVTAFRDYLRCPYRFYLNHCLKLKSVIPDDEELDARAFGTVLHDVLQAFAEDPQLRESDGAEEIRGFLQAKLDAEVTRRYGPRPEPALRIQQGRMRARLSRFAEWQADWRRQGWRIEFAEKKVEGPKAKLTVDGEPMFLTGRIDRVDRHEETGRRIIFDYKTGDTAKSPDQTHRKQKTEWVDLQLPLYRYLFEELGIDGDVDLAYINLPKKLKEVGESRAVWTAEELAAADAVATDVVRAVRAERFWPPAEDGGLQTEFAAICMEDILGRTLADEEEGE